jgi:hypothetical protein
MSNNTDLVKHFTELATATHRLANVLNDTWSVLDDDFAHKDALADAIDLFYNGARDLDSLAFMLILDAEDDIKRGEKK